MLTDSLVNKNRNNNNKYAPVIQIKRHPIIMAGINIISSFLV